MAISIEKKAFKLYILPQLSNLEKSKLESYVEVLNIECLDIPTYVLQSIAKMIRFGISSGENTKTSQEMDKLGQELVDLGFIPEFETNVELENSLVRLYETNKKIKEIKEEAKNYINTLYNKFFTKKVKILLKTKIIKNKKILSFNKKVKLKKEIKTFGKIKKDIPKNKFYLLSLLDNLKFNLTKNLPKSKPILDVAKSIVKNQGLIFDNLILLQRVKNFICCKQKKIKNSFKKLDFDFYILYKNLKA